MNAKQLAIPAEVELISPRLTKREVERLQRLEGIIGSGLKTFVEVGNALMEVREGRLYRERFKSFAIYCRSKWGITKTHANRMIAGAEVAENIKDVGPLPVTEAVVRPLTILEPEHQRKVWQRVLELRPRAVTQNYVTRVLHEVIPAQEIKQRKKREARRRTMVNRTAVFAILDGWESLVVRSAKKGKSVTPEIAVEAIRAEIERL